MISEASIAGLEVYRRFRHLVRNVYATDLVPERMAPVVDTLPTVWVQLQAELLAFAGFWPRRRNHVPTPECSSVWWRIVVHSRLSVYRSSRRCFLAL